MKKRQMERWVKALRSGKFKQWSGRLYVAEAEGHCCLGVLCAINEKSLTLKEQKEMFCGEAESLFSSIMDLTGIKDAEGQFIDLSGTIGNLAHLNDNGKSFTEIADIIEQNYKRL